jgi:hypothetical protein
LQIAKALNTLTNEPKIIYLKEILTALLNIFLIKNGVGNRPDDAVATAPILRGPGAKSCPVKCGER